MRKLVAAMFLGLGVFVACSSGDPTASPDGDDSSGAATDASGKKKKTPVECGTATTKACEGTECKADADCESKKCESGKCTQPLPASATDNTQNAGETDVDCGGPNAGKCADGKKCAEAGDCTSAVCNGTCQAPTATDGTKNGDETDVDCGGTTTKAPKCAVGKSCAAHGDCESDGCDDTKHCAVSRSCTQTNGGLTCGAGEVGDKDAKHESCCLALPIPGSTTKLDKYKVTAGRMRAFIERTKGDVKGWYTSNKATLSDAARGQIDPFVDRLPHDIDSEGSDGSDGNAAGAKWQLGGTVFYEDRPSTSQGCYTGDANNQAFGAHTYWTGADEGEDRGFDQQFLDRLPLNCVPYPLMAAFCAWDGGRLQTWEENSAAYGPSSYPWGETPEAGGFGELDGNAFTEKGPARYIAGQGFNSCPGCDRTIMNWSSTYQNPEGGNANKPWDFAYFISPPGRFPGDKGPGGHMDIGGDLLELTASPGVGESATDPKYGATVRWGRSGSWEGHQANYTGWQFAIMTKYGKTGGRCARD
jgi:hypothetical protein